MQTVEWKSLAQQVAEFEEKPPQRCHIVAERGAPSAPTQAQVQLCMLPQKADLCLRMPPMQCPADVLQGMTVLVNVHKLHHDQAQQSPLQLLDGCSLPAWQRMAVCVASACSLRQRPRRRPWQPCPPSMLAPSGTPASSFCKPREITHCITALSCFSQLTLQ